MQSGDIEVKNLLKFLLVAAQAGNLAALIVFGSRANYWLIPPALLPFAILIYLALTGRANCIHCSTPFLG